MRRRMRRVTNWQSGEMAVRWAAVTFLDTERSYRRILGYHQLWILKAHLDERFEEDGIAARKKAV